MIRMKDLLLENIIMDLPEAEALRDELNKRLDAPFVQATVSTLGGRERPTVMLKVAMQPKSEWPNGIYQNSTYSQFSIQHDGNIEQFATYGFSKKFRKTKFKNADEVIKKINKYLKEAGKLK